MDESRMRGKDVWMTKTLWRHYLDMEGNEVARFEHGRNGLTYLCSVSHNFDSTKNCGMSPT